MSDNGEGWIASDEMWARNLLAQEMRVMGLPDEDIARVSSQRLLLKTERGRRCSLFWLVTGPPDLVPCARSPSSTMPLAAHSRRFQAGTFASTRTALSIMSRVLIPVGFTFASSKDTNCLGLSCVRTMRSRYLSTPQRKRRLQPWGIAPMAEVVGLNGEAVAAEIPARTPVVVLRELIARIENGTLELEDVLVIGVKSANGGNVTVPTWDSNISLASFIWMIESAKFDILMLTRQS